jgi:hypothetical protein
MNMNIYIYIYIYQKVIVVIMIIVIVMTIIRGTRYWRIGARLLQGVALCGGLGENILAMPIW